MPMKYPRSSIGSVCFVALTGLGVVVGLRLPLFVALLIGNAVLFLGGLSRRERRDLLNPVVMYNVAVLLLISTGVAFVGFGHTNVGVAGVDATILTNLSAGLPVASLIGFNFGWILTAGAGTARRMVGTENIAVKTALIVCSIGLGFAFISTVRNGIPLLSSSVYKGNVVVGGTVVKAVEQLSLVLAPIALFFFFRGRGQWRLIGGALFCAYFLYAMLSTQRNLIELPVLAVVLYAAYYQRWLTQRRLLLIAVVLFLALVWFGVARNSRTYQGPDRSAYLRAELGWSVFANQYEKLRLDYLVTSQHYDLSAYPFGRFAFSGVYQLLPGPQPAEDQLFRTILYGQPNVRSPVAVPFHSVLFFDFGWLGLILGMSALGAFAHVVYASFLRTPDLRHFVLFTFSYWLLIQRTLYADLVSRTDVLVAGLLLLLLFLATSRPAAVGHRALDLLRLPGAIPAHAPDGTSAQSSE